MSITLFPDSERINLTEDNTSAHSNLENYTGIVFDTDKNKFSVVTGKFRDKKDMYDKMTKQDKYLRRAYESRIFDWIEENATNAVEGYLMLSTAVSKWKNNNVLSKYYKKLLHDLPYINREGRKGDPQTMGKKASFESIEKDEVTKLCEDIKSKLGQTDEYMQKAFIDQVNEANLTLKYYNLRVAPFTTVGGSVYYYNEGSDKLDIDKDGHVNNKFAGFISDMPETSEDKELTSKWYRVTRKDKATGRKILAGYWNAANNRLYKELLGNEPIGTADSRTFKIPQKSEYVYLSNVPGCEEYLHNKDISAGNPIFMIRLNQAIKSVDSLKDGTVYSVEVLDPKTENQIARYKLSRKQIVAGGLSFAYRMSSGQVDLANFKQKLANPIPMSREEEMNRELDAAISTASHPGNILHNADMFSGIANSQDRLAQLRKDQEKERQVYNNMDNRAASYNKDTYTKKVQELKKVFEKSKKIIDTYKQKEATWKQMRDDAKNKNASMEELKQINKKYHPSEQELNAYQKAIDDVQKARQELKLLQNDSVEESLDTTKYVNDGANALKQWTDATYINSASFQEANTQSKLNQDLFDNKELRADVRQALLDIAAKFKDSLKISQEPVDIYFTGSEANYNYNENSDIDVHLVYDYEQAGITAEVLDKYLQTAKKVFNDHYNITVKGLPVEVGAENIATPLVTSGVYSLVNDKWVIEPENANREIEEPEEPYYNEVKNIIEDAIVSNDSETIGNAVEFIWSIRKEGLAKEGEFGPSNTLFKKLRNEGLLSQLRQAYYDAESNDLSLESMMKEAEFDSKENATKEISDDLFDKSENEIVDGLLNHYSTEAEAIAKVEDVMKTVSDGYKDKLQNVITKIKESTTFGKSCRTIVEKALARINEANTSELIKNISDKLAKEYLSQANNNITKATNIIKNDDAILDKISQEDKDILQANNIEPERAKSAIVNTVLNIVTKTNSDEQFNKDVSTAKNMRPVVRGAEYRKQRAQDLKVPANYNVISFVNLFKDAADLGLYLSIIKARFPIAILDHPHAFYVVDDEGNRLCVKGIEHGLNPQNLWVEVIEPEAKGRKIGYFNGEQVIDINNNPIGYADGNKAYLNNGTYLGPIDKQGNVLDTKGHYAANRMEAQDAFAMPIEEYREILNNPRNADVLAKAEEATDKIFEMLSPEERDSVGAVYNYVKNAEKGINNAQKLWELENQDEPVLINHYDSVTRELIYIRTQKLGQSMDKVLNDYKDRFSDKPYYEVTPETVKTLKGESTEELTEADDKYYTLAKHPRKFIELLNDMGIDTTYATAILTLDNKDIATTKYKISGINQNINDGAQIQFVGEDNLSNDNVTVLPDNRLLFRKDNESEVIGYVPLPSLADYDSKNPAQSNLRPVFIYADEAKDKMKYAGFLSKWNSNDVFKLMPVDSEGKRLTGTLAKEEKFSIQRMFDLLTKPENSPETIAHDKLAMSDMGLNKARKEFTSGRQNGNWITLTDDEIYRALKFISNGHEDDIINTQTKETVGQTYKEYQQNGIVTDNVMKLLRRIDPNKAEYIKRDRNGNVNLYVAFGDAPASTPVAHRKTPLEKALSHMNK